MKIVILPGLDGTGDLLADFDRLLAQNYATQVMSYPVEMHQYSTIKEWLLKRLPEEDYFIVAESFSGPLAAQIAASRPPNLKGVVFVATFVKPPRKVPSGLTRLLTFLPIRSKLFVRLSLPFVMGRFATGAFAKAMHDTLQRVPKATIIGRLREVLNVNLRTEIQSIAVPCAYLAANGDRLLSSSASNDFRKDGIDYLALEGPHFILQAKPKEAHAMISGFLKRATSREERQTGRSASL